jgi:hypothetical protein
VARALLYLADGASPALAARVAAASQAYWIGCLTRIHKTSSPGSA